MPQLLKQHAQLTATHVAPAAAAEARDIVAVERYAAAIVAPLAVEEAAQRRLAATRRGLDQISLTALECHGREPNIGPEIFALGEDLRNDTIECN